jgi:uncharacterized membrane protein
VIEIRTSVEIEVPAAAAWSVVADYAQDTAWRRGVTAMVPEPPGLVALGTTAHEEMTFGGRALVNDGVVTRVEPGRSFSWRTTSGVDAEGSRLVEPLGDRRCRVTLVLRARPHGVEHLLVPIYRRMLARGLAHDAAELSALLERQAVIRP